MVTITQVGNTTFVRPTPKQLADLHRLAVGFAPALGPQGDRDEHNSYGGFCDAFLAIGASMSVTSDGKPDLGRALSWFADHLAYQYSARGRSCNILSRDVMLAVMAIGAPYSFDAERWPYDAGVGIAIGGGTPFVEQWRSVLARGRPGPPTPLPPNYSKFQSLTPIQGAR